MNRWDSLLGWLSHHGDTSWTNIKIASQKLSQLEGFEKEMSPLAHAMYWAGPLIQLGQAEFDPRSKTLSTISPGLLRTSSGERAILYGYWDRQLKKILRTANVILFVHRPKRGPTGWSIRGSHAAFEELSARAGIWLGEDMSLSLLKRLPAISSLLDNLNREHAGTDGIWEQLFEIDASLRWRVSRSPLSSPGLFRRRNGRPIQVLVKSDLLAYRLDTMEQKLAAKWDQLTKRDWIYDATCRRLLVPFGSPPLPTLVSRALTLTSARLPIEIRCFGSVWWSYSGVTIMHAEQATRIMEQEFSTRNVISE